MSAESSGDDLLGFRLKERDAEYQHRLLELELAADGLAPVGADPRAQSHGAREFVSQMQGVDIDTIVPTLRAVHSEGYAIVENFLSADEVDELRTGLSDFFDATERLFDSPDNQVNVFEGKQTVHVQNLFAKTDVADSTATKQNLRAIMAGILGRDFIFNAGAVAMAPTPGCAPQGLHRDDGFYALIPRPHIPLVVTAAIALDDFTQKNGGTQLVPGSHLWSTERDPEPDEVIYAEMAAGSMLLWDGALYHGGGANQTTTQRRTLTFNYTRGWLRTQFNQYLSIPRDRILQMPTELQTDLGYHRSALGLGGADMLDPLKYLKQMQDEGGDGAQPRLGREH